MPASRRERATCIAHIKAGRCPHTPASLGACLTSPLPMRAQSDSDIYEAETHRINDESPLRAGIACKCNHADSLRGRDIVRLDGPRKTPHVTTNFGKKENTIFETNKNESRFEAQSPTRKYVIRVWASLAETTG